MDKFALDQRHFEVREEVRSPSVAFDILGPAKMLAPLHELPEELSDRLSLQKLRLLIAGTEAPSWPLEYFAVTLVSALTYPLPLRMYCQGWIHLES